jgi:hypothetical protein
MNRQQLERYLRAQGCRMHHHGAKHDVWLNRRTGARTSVPRHATIKRGTVRASAVIWAYHGPRESSLSIYFILT